MKTKRMPMSVKTGALLSDLQSDLQDHLDPYQFACTVDGKSIWPDATTEQVAAAALVSKIFSKLTESSKPSEASCERALEKFLTVNNRCGDFRFEPLNYFEEQLIGELKFTLWKFFNPNGYPLIDSIEKVISRGGVGPGASIGARGDDLYTKIFDSSISYTREDLLFSWEYTVAQDDRWFSALARSYNQGRVPRAVRGSKLSFVVKNERVARTICTEPTINMWVQLGIGACLQTQLQRVYGISLSDQADVNKRMALHASNGADLCTIDLESASDSVSVRLLREIIPQDALEMLMLSRSPECTLPDGRVVSLNMISTMGNGFTFPLQTIVFSAIVDAVYKCMDIPLIKRGLPRHRNFGTFGDDILCCKRAYRQVVRLLNLCGFRVNEQKSFNEGPFYESCGGDFHRGSDVRPFYLKSLEVDSDLYKAINGLNRWSARTGIQIPRTVQRLLSWTKKKLWVPPHESDDAGIHIPFDMVRELWAKPRYAYLGSVCYTALVPRKQYLLVMEDVILSGKNQRTRCYNPDGLWLSFLFGSVKAVWDVRQCNAVYDENENIIGASRSRITTRGNERTLYATKRKVTPNWDALSPVLLAWKVSWPRWSSAASRNLSIP